MSTEIGQALLARYELLENKFRKEVERYEHQVCGTAQLDKQHYVTVF
jgi:molybdenum-dependent DNA-binding transcriptional regulator ModE